MLHREGVASTDKTHGETVGMTGPSSEQIEINHVNMSDLRVMLATTVIWISSRSGRMVQVRALVDPGSTRFFVSRQVYAALGERGDVLLVPMTGLGGVSVGQAA